ncbi:MAG: XRE family transcriptional regulator [Acidobacteria bacterium]|nr:XRE family transcriptional regulator [Acidobacteriota bacterium]
MAKSFNTLREKMSPERHAQNEARTQQAIAEIALQELRQSLNLTQEQVGEMLQMNQAAVSRMERQSDMYISTLQRLVTALGGKLKIVASFPDKDVVINQFE